MTNEVRIWISEFQAGCQAMTRLANQDLEGMEFLDTGYEDPSKTKSGANSVAGPARSAGQDV